MMTRVLVDWRSKSNQKLVRMVIAPNGVKRTSSTTVSGGKVAMIKRASFSSNVTPSFVKYTNQCEAT